MTSPETHAALVSTVRETDAAYQRAIESLEPFKDRTDGFVTFAIDLRSSRERFLDMMEPYVRVVGHCGHCQKLLIEGDKGHRCLDGDPLFCEEHAFTWANVLESYSGEGCLETEDPDAFAAFKARLVQHLDAGGSAGDRILHVL